MNDPYLDLLDELKELTLKKRAGYSPGADPFANFRQSALFGVDPLKGILVRVMDKLSRVASLLEDPDNDKIGESLRDNLLDAGNYLLIGVAFRDAADEGEYAIPREVIEKDSARAQVCCFPDNCGCTVPCTECYGDCECASGKFDCGSPGCSSCSPIAPAEEVDGPVTYVGNCGVPGCTLGDCGLINS